MTDIHKLAEQASGWIPVGRLNKDERATLAGAIERALTMLQAEHEAERHAAVAEAIERCAKVCEGQKFDIRPGCTSNSYVERAMTAEECANTIRALK